MDFHDKTVSKEKKNKFSFITTVFIIWIMFLILMFSIAFTIKFANKIVDLIKLNQESVVYKTEIVKVNPNYQIFEITAYTAGKESTGKTESHALYGITASGEPALERITIACPKSMPFGTKVYIPAFETVFTCMDRGSAITEGKLDIYMEDIVHAQMFGRQKLQAMVLPE